MSRCEHCLLEVDERDIIRDGEGKQFCCEGCRAVYSFIRHEGLETFYQKREWNADEARKAEVPGDIETAAFEEIVGEDNGCRTIDLYVDGIRCASCVWLVEKVVGKTAGVVSARVNYATHKARVKWDPARVDLQGILNRIGATGYVPKPYSESERLLARRAEQHDLLIRFGTAAFLSCQLMMYSAALYAGYFQGMDAAIRRSFEFIAMFLTAPVLFYAGLPLVRSTVAGFRGGRFNMDSLIVLGAGSAFFYSIYSLLRGGEVYFDTAAMIVTLILLGRYIESQAKGRASEAVERLAELTPKTATAVTIDESGEPAERRPVSAASLVPGQYVETKPGEKFAADGVVVHGSSSADESLITGESRSVHKGSGDRVIGGSINRFGAVVFSVTRTGRETVLARIIQLVEDAQNERPAIQGFADRVVGVFVPVILAVAGLTAAYHFNAGAGVEQALMTGISVLVIACPCSLGLATPLAVLVYTGTASSRGVLVKRGDVVENTALAGDIILDKTGTVTEGSFRLRDFFTLDPDIDDRYCLCLAASVESSSEHDLAGALIEEYGGGSLIPVKGFRALPGRGVTAAADGRDVFIGSGRLMNDKGIDLHVAGAAGEEVRAAVGKGETLVYMGWEGRARAVFLFTDGLRAEAPGAVAELRSAGMEVSLVSGDTVEATESIAGRAGIDSAEGGASPGRKREIVKERQGKGRVVMMVGDGINDAPALTEARVGIAVGRGTDVAMESADAVLTRNDLRLLPWFIRLSRGTFSIIRQNIFWAFFYNVIAIPLAVKGVLHPIVAAAAMASSSLFVVFNSLRIRKYGGGG